MSTRLILFATPPCLRDSQQRSGKANRKRTSELLVLAFTVPAFSEIETQSISAGVIRSWPVTAWSVCSPEIRCQLQQPYYSLLVITAS